MRSNHLLIAILTIVALAACNRETPLSVNEKNPVFSESGNHIIGIIDENGQIVPKLSEVELLKLVSFHQPEGNKLLNAFIDCEQGKWYFLNGTGKDGENRDLLVSIRLTLDGNKLIYPSGERHLEHSCSSICDIGCSKRLDAGGTQIGCDCSASPSSGFCNHTVTLVDDK